MELRQLIGRHGVIVLLLFIVVFSVGLRFINEGLFHYDSVRLAQTVEENFRTGTFRGISAGGRYGMVVVASAVYYPFFLAGQNADFAVRLTSLLMLALSAAAIYLLTFEMSRSRFGAFAAALLMSVTPLFIIPSTYGKEHSTAVFFFTLACYCALRGQRSRALLWPITASLLYTFSLSVRETFVLGLPAFVWFIVFPRVRRTEGIWCVIVGRHWKVGVASLVVIVGVVLVSFLGAQLVSIAGDKGAAAVMLSFKLFIGGMSAFVTHTRWMWPFFLFGLYVVWRTGRDYLVPLFFVKFQEFLADFVERY